jgi:putative tricarboxylic transport membrane protein
MEGTAALRKDCRSSVILLVIGAGYLWYALRYPVETLENPGPGVFPVAVGLLLVVLSALQLVQVGRRLLLVARTDRAPGSPSACPTDQPNRAEIGRAPWLMVGVLVLYLFVVTWIGFLTCTFALVLTCSKLMGTRSWGRAVSLAGGVVLVCYFLFSVWLKVPLPTGSLM